MAVETQPESYSDSRLQHITLGVRGTSQKSQTNVAEIFSSCQWGLGKISSHNTAWSPLNSLGSLIYRPPLCTLPTHTHPPPQSLRPFVFHRKQVDKPQLSIS